MSRHSSSTPSKTDLVLAVGALVGFAAVLLPAWAFGGVFFWTQWAAGIAILAALIVTGLGNPPVSWVLLRRSWHIWPVLLAVALGWFQSATLPTSLVARLSPEAVALDQEFAPPVESIESAPTTAEPTSPPAAQIAAGTPISISRGYTRTATAQLSIALAAYLLGITLFARERVFRWFLYAVTINGVALALFGLIQYLTWNGKIFWTVEVPSAWAFSTYVNRNNAGGYLCLCLAATIGLVSSRREGELGISTLKHVPLLERFRFFFNSIVEQVNHSNRLLLLVGTVIICSGVIATLSRGACLALVVGLMAATWVSWRRGSRLVGTLLIAVMVLGAVMAAFLGRLSTFGERVFGHTGQIAALRPKVWAEAFGIFTDFPIVGTGLGTFQLISPLYQECIQDAWIQHAENVFVEGLVEGGIIGILLLLAALAFMFRGLSSINRDSSDNGMLVTCFGAFLLASQIVAAMFDFGLYLSANMILCAALCGAFMGRVRMAEHEAEHEAGASYRPQPLTLCVVGLALVALVIGLVDLWPTVQLERLTAQAFFTMSRDDVSDEFAVQCEQMAARVTHAAERRVVDSDALRTAADMNVHAFRVEALRAIPGDKTNTELKDALWLVTDPKNLFSRLKQLESLQVPQQLEAVRGQAAIQKYLVAARNALLKARDESPLNRGVHRQLAILAPVVGDDFVPHVERAMRIAPASSATKVECGLLLSLANNTSRGNALMRDAIRQNEEVVPSILAARSLFGSDERWFDEVFPRQPLQLIDFADKYCKEDSNQGLGQRLRDRALEIVTSDAHEFDEATRLYVKARVIESRQDRNEALESLVLAVEKAPDRVDWRFDLALMFERARLLEQAEREMRRCVAQQPKSGVYRSALQRVIYRRNENKRRSQSPAGAG